LETARLAVLGDRPCPLEALDEIVGRQVDDLDIVGAVDDRIRNGLAHADTGDLRDDVVQALEMLDVERRVDVDAARQQFLDVEIALGMAAAGRVGMGELVDEDERGAPRQDRIEVHLVEGAALVVDERGAGRSRSPSSSACVSLRPWVSTTPITTSTPSVWLRASGGQHLVGLADAGRRAEEDLQAPRGPRVGRWPAAPPARAYLRSSRDGCRLGHAVRRGNAAAPSRAAGVFVSALGGAVESQVEGEHVDDRLAHEAEFAAARHGYRREPRTSPGRHPARLGDARRPGNRRPRARYAGSSPLPEVVTSSIGTGASGSRP
jgi:hypothetical protein